MYKQTFLPYVWNGLILGFFNALITVSSFKLLGILFQHPTDFIGHNQNSLYIVFIIFATFTATFLGSILFYFFQKFSKRPVLLLISISLVGFTANTILAEKQLLSEFLITAHILHIIVLLVAIICIPNVLRVRVK